MILFHLKRPEKPITRGVLAGACVWASSLFVGACSPAKKSTIEPTTQLKPQASKDAGGLFRSQAQALGAAAGQTLRSAPNFNLPDQAGRSHFLQSFKGKWILVHFWAAWCPPCRSEISEWIELGAHLKDKTIQFIAVSMDPDWEEVEKVVPSKSVPPQIISLIDPSVKTPETYGTYQFPETYLINPEQKIVTKWVGPQNWGDPKIKEFFVKLTETTR